MAKKTIILKVKPVAKRAFRIIKKEPIAKTRKYA